MFHVFTPINELRVAPVESAVLLRHYGDSKKDRGRKSTNNKVQLFVLRNGTPKVPVLRLETAPLQKLHYRVHDGTSVI